MNIPSFSALLVDDDVCARDIFQIVMKHDGLVAMTADDAAAALRCLKTCTPDIILLDLYLPDRHGYRVVQQIREESPDTPRLIIATTACPRTSILDEVFDRDFDGYLPKPWDVSHLVPMLAQFVQVSRSEWGTRMQAAQHSGQA